MRRSEWLVLPYLLLTLVIILLGIITGALMNALNATISGAYFQLVLNLQTSDVMLPAVEHGMLEGLVIGLSLGVTFLLYTAFVSKLAAPHRTVGRVLPRTLGVLWIAWASMGLNAMVLFWFAPQLPIFASPYFMFIAPATLAPTMDYGAALRFVWWAARSGALI